MHGATAMRILERLGVQTSSLLVNLNEFIANFLFGLYILTFLIYTANVYRGLQGD